jgi:hypothetical protein
VKHRVEEQAMKRRFGRAALLATAGNFHPFTSPRIQLARPGNPGGGLFLPPLG